MGLRTLLVERSPEPRDKVGEALHPGVEALLRELGVADRVSEVTGARFPGVEVGWGGPPQLQPFGGDAEGPWLGFQLDRRGFDARLLERARNQGAEVRRAVTLDRPLLDGEAVAGAVTTAGESLPARVVIDASGPAAWLSRRLGVGWMRRSPPLTVRYGYVRASGQAAPRLTGDTDGWTWTAQVAPDLRQWANLALPGRAPRPEPPPECAGLPPVGPPRGADATWRIAERLAGPVWLLAGEAAASLDPASSKGVLRALPSGLFAGRTAAAIRARGAPADEGARAYDGWLRRGFETEVRALAPMYAQLGAAGFGDVAAPRRPALRQGS